jgi:glycosyltransferase involved in cell wall biosynthesis
VGGNVLATVSVLFPVHRETQFLSEALDSLLKQDFESYEILFLDNSEIGINPIIWNRSSKVVQLKLPAEYGLSDALNYGIKYSRSTYVVRMDYDDISLPSRIKRQVEFMERNPHIDISGTGIKFFGESLGARELETPEIYRPEDWRLISSYLLYKNPLFHPTVIMRRTSLIENDLFYNSKFDAAEDLDLWMRASHKLKISNIHEVLLHYRVHLAQFSREDGINSRIQSAKIRTKHAIWYIIHNPIEWKIGIKSLIHNSLFLVQNFPRYLIRRRFNKFD